MADRRRKGKSIIDFPGEYVCLDIETTGLDLSEDEIIEVAASRVENGTVIDTFERLVRPKKSHALLLISKLGQMPPEEVRNFWNTHLISDAISELTGISNEMLLAADPDEVVLPELKSFIGDSVIVGHNVNFDVNFIYDALERLGESFSNDYIDTMRIARKLFPDLPHHRLEDVACHLGIQQDVRHRAGADVFDTIQCFERMSEMAKEKGGLGSSRKGSKAKKTNHNRRFEVKQMDADREYRQFTKPAELHKAINTLRGLVAGINSDLDVGAKEVTELAHWCELHAHLRDRHPFSEILPVVEHAYEDGVVTEDEAKDILWLCNNFVDDSSYYDMVTSSIQFLAGMLHGLLADGELSDREIATLKAWIDANDFLAGTYPFDEINSLLHVVLEDKKITADEREKLMAFFGNVIDFTASYNLSEKDFSQLREKYSIGGICAVCPEITFEGKLFCFTGESYRAKRAEIVETIARLGGKARSSVSAKTDYLVVGNAGNPCWAYACYGRKIEEAVNLRKEGASVVIVNETDFWDAVDDALAGVTD